MQGQSPSLPTFRNQIPLKLYDRMMIKKKLFIWKYTFEFIVRTEMTCDISKYES